MLNFMRKAWSTTRFYLHQIDLPSRPRLSVAVTRICSMSYNIIPTHRFEKELNRPSPRSRQFETGGSNTLRDRPSCMHGSFIIDC